MSDEADAAKAALRRNAAAVRAAAHAAEPDAGERLAAAFPGFMIPRPGGVVAGYGPIRTEVDPHPLMRRLARRGVRIALPVTPRDDGEDGGLLFRLWREGDPLTSGALGILEPGPQVPVVEPALLLLPLLAFDRVGGRLGYGGGWYDRTLAALRARGPVTAVGLAFAAQEVERVPVGPNDAPLDGIVTERAYIAVR